MEYLNNERNKKIKSEKITSQGGNKNAGFGKGNAWKGGGGQIRRRSVQHQQSWMDKIHNWEEIQLVLRFKNTDNLKENPDGLIDVLKKYESKLELDESSLKRLREKNIGKTFELVFNINAESEKEFETIRKGIAIELQKLGYKVDPNFLKYDIIL